MRNRRRRGPDTSAEDPIVLGGAERFQVNGVSSSQADLSGIIDIPAVAREFGIHNVIATFGEILRFSRRGAGLTQAELSGRSGVSRSAIADIEAGIIPDGPRLATLVRLFGACGKIIDPTAAILDPCRPLGKSDVQTSESVGVVLTYRKKNLTNTR